jgi:hypothetical protein
MHRKFWPIIFLLIPFAAGCQPEPRRTADQVRTDAAQTLEEILTGAAPAATTAAPEAGTPSATLQTFATSTPLEFPTETRAPSATQFEVPCYRADLAGESPEDYYNKFGPGEIFVKTWTLRNTGTCKWSADVKLVFVSGSKMDGPDEQKIGVEVAMGETVNVSVTLKAPLLPDQYQGNWMLRNQYGGRFGVGVRGEAPFWVIIIIRSGTVTVTATRTATPTATGPGAASATPTPTLPLAQPTATPTHPEPTTEVPTLAPSDTATEPQPEAPTPTETLAG